MLYIVRSTQFSGNVESVNRLGIKFRGSRSAQPVDLVSKPSFGVYVRETVAERRETLDTDETQQWDRQVREHSR